MRIKHRENVEPRGNFGKLLQFLGPGGGGRADEEETDECWAAHSLLEIGVDMQGGPQHQIRYCWDKSVGNGRDDGDYVSNGWVNGEHGPDPKATTSYQHRYTEVDDLYEGNFTVKRKLVRLVEGGLEGGGCGIGGGGTDCPEYDCCCPDIPGTDPPEPCGDGAGYTLLSLNYEVFDYVTPALEHQGGAERPILSSIEANSDSFDLCKPEDIERLTALKEHLSTYVDTKEVKLQVNIKSFNSRQRCFQGTSEEIEDEKERWCGGYVDGEKVWGEVKKVCKIPTVSIESVAAFIKDIPSLLCNRLTGGACGGRTTCDELGLFSMGRSFPNECRTPNDPAGLGDNGPSNWWTVKRYYKVPAGDDWGHKRKHLEHGEDSYAYDEGRYGSRSCILAIIDAVIDDPTGRMCDYHKVEPMQLLGSMGRFGKGLLCLAIKWKKEEGIPWPFGSMVFGRLAQPVTVGMSWCLNAVKSLLGG